MKKNLLFVLSGLALSWLFLSGCYTQLALPDQNEESRIARESEPADEDSVQAYDRDASDARQVHKYSHTDVYIYGGGWYGPYRYPWWYRYPYTRFYVSFGYYDPWGWCGTPWDWYVDPWYWDYYYSSYWWPYYGWHRGYYYGPYYPYPHYVYRDRDVESKKRSFTRRGSSQQPENPAGTYTTSGRGSLAKPAAGIYARGDDGSYRRVRRDEVSSTDRRDQPAAVPDRSKAVKDDGRRSAKRSMGSGNDTYRVPDATRSRPEPSSSGSGDRRSSGSSGSGSVSKPSGSGSSGSGSAPRSSGGSSSSGSSDRRKRN
ncbi:MAG: hypothetical protein ONB44_06995 [candidate division KSB1 bacterium]|nr:hypothetical protein [candidate division KSB1 bacterium]MDZ7301871.1 hypothetical protein [candidate division KSB1 bacterium]MDZ7310254.1 hypothetical protein [candidate division KSB1 bacterium]